MQPQILLVSLLQIGETFYKDSLLAELQGEKVSDQERFRMKQLLEKFEKQSREEEDSDDEDSDLPDLSERLQGLDLDNASPEAILSALTPSEREVFEKMVRGEGGNVDAILPLWRPWWQTAEKTRPFVDLSAPTESALGSARPPILSNMPSIDKIAKVKPSPNLVYNLLDILFSYAFVSRYLNGDLTEDTVGTCQILWDLSLVLSSNQPFAFDGVREAVATIKSKVTQKTTYGITSHTIISLLQDVTSIFSSPTSTLAALSDIHTLFSAASRASEPTDPTSPSTPQPSIPRALRQKAFASSKK
ncbi:hypothetical protein HK097_005045, partial [Rhizophlyctis rosea]